jgi:hypothetical protein
MNDTQPSLTPVPGWFALATRPSVVRRGLLFAVIVGTVLITINHGDTILRGEVTTGRLLKMGLTVMVPYIVSTLSRVGALRSAARARADGTTT